MIFSKKRISDLLINSKQMINIASADEEIKTALLEYNYTEEVLNQGKEIFTKSDELTREYTAAVGQKLAAADEFNKARKQAHVLFVEHLKFTRMAYRNEPEKLVELKVPEHIERKVTAWLFQVGHYYTTALANDALIEKLSRYGISKEKLEAADQLVEEAGKAREKQKKLKGKVQGLKVRRDEALEKLDDWITEFALVCRYALKDNPQLLEKLGIQVLSAGYHRKKKEKEINEEEQNPYNNTN